MKPYYNHSKIQIFNGNALNVLKNIETESIQCCVTSPPYWGLRDYGLLPMIWDGDKNCKHEWGNHQSGRVTGGGDRPPDNKWKKVAADGNYDSKSIRSFCQKCEAWKGSLGLEPTIELYVKHLVEIFSEVKRVLKADGILWLNLGDSYAGSGSPGGDFRNGKCGDEYLHQYNRNDLPGKNLCGIPWHIAFALQNDGWVLRQDIIWDKPSCMPESVKDRCTKSHEYIFLLTKSAKYFYDADAIKEPFAESTLNDKRDPADATRKERDYPSGNQHGEHLLLNINRNGRNKRSVWRMSTRSFKAAHFATFPPELPRTCILAGSKAYDTILDPFAGAMTTLMVAQQLNRKAIGIELSEAYIKMGLKRLQQKYLPFKYT